MTKAVIGLQALCWPLIFAAFVILMGSVPLQVVSCTFLSTAPVWTEELTRFCLIFMAVLGAGQGPFALALLPAAWDDTAIGARQTAPV